MAKMKVGEVTHYYDKIKVAIVELGASLATGDQVVFERGGEELYQQKVTSMQIEHKKVKDAKKGDVIGLEVDEPVKEGAEVYKL